jgi:hypothetical protein
VVEVNLSNGGLYFPVLSAILESSEICWFNGSLSITIHGFPVPSDPICLSMYVYRNEFDYLLSKGVPSPVPSSNKGLDSSGVNETPICNKSWGRSTLPCHSRRRIC